MEFYATWASICSYSYGNFVGFSNLTALMGRFFGGVREG